MVVLVGVSLALQLATTAVAVWQIRHAGRATGWVLLSGALFLMCVRRAITFAELVTGNTAVTAAPAAEWVALAISALMLLGVVWIGPVLRRSQQEEEKSRERERLLADRLPVLISHVDRDLRYRFVNTAYQDWFGRSSREILGMRITELLGEAAFEARRPSIEAALRGEQVRFEATTPHKDGTVRPTLITYVPEVSDGNVRGFYALVEDVTARKESERRLGAQLRLTDALAAAERLEDASREIVGPLAESLGFDAGNLWRVDEAARVLRHLAGWHAPSVPPDALECLSSGFAFGPGDGLPGRVWQSRRPLWVPDVAADDNFPRRDAAERAGFRAAVAFPVLSGDEVLGVIEFFSTRRRPSEDGLLSFMAVVGGQVGQLIRRVEAGEALRQSEARSKAVIDTAIDCIIGMDHEGRITEFNPAAERVFGFQRGEVLGREMCESIIPPEHCEAHRAGLKRYLATGEPRVLGRRIEMPALRKGGARFDSELSITRNPGEPATFTAFMRDITAQKRAESRHRFLLGLDDALRTLTDPAQVVATSARLLGEHMGVDRCAYAEVEADQDAFNLIGDYTRPGIPSIAGRHRLSDFGREALRLHREHHPYVVEDVETDPAAGEDLAAYRKTMIRAAISVPLHKGETFVAGMAVHQATPRRWQADEVELVSAVASRCWESIERARAVRQLAEGEARFRLMANSIPQLAWMARGDGWIFWYNQRWYDYTGTTPEEMQGWGWEKVHDAGELPRVLEKWKAAHASGVPWEDTFPLRRHDGELRWHLSRAEPLRDSDGSVIFWFGTNTDVTESRQAAEERERLLSAETKARAEAEKASRLKDEFLATLSHELRTPLNAILGWSQLLQRGRPEDIEEGLAVITRNARSQAQLIEELLDMSRIVSGKLRIDVQRLNLAEVINAAADSVRPAADAKDIRIQTVLDAHVGPVRGDPGRLQQVVWNLLTNAVKFTPKGGRVQVALERVNSHVEVTVTDTGEGIRPEFLPHVFDRFRQADSTTTRAYGGLGLGLAIVKSIVEAHGGKVRAKSPGEGQGSTFSVELPLMVVHVGDEPEEVPRRHPRAPSPEDDARAVCNARVLEGVTVLVVDDERDARELIRRVLEDCRATVTVAADVASALDLLMRERPAVLLSDIGMPGEDGYALIRQVRELSADAGGDTPAAALTAFARSEDRRRALLAGFQSHVSKPVEPAELVAVVASLAGKMGRAGR
jgi:PAS domain S-box-containing protein